MNREQELAEQARAAAEAGNLEEVKRITNELEQLRGPQSFAAAWNYENKIPDPQPGSFAEAWGFQPGKDKTR